MNTSFRSIWNPALSAWVAVSEVARARGKSVSTAVGVATVIACLGTAPAFAGDGGAGGHPATPTVLYAGDGGADNIGGAGAFNDNVYNGFGGAGGVATTTGATAGGTSTAGTWPPGQGIAGGAAGTAVARDGQAGGAFDVNDPSSNGYGGGGGAGYFGGTGASGTNTTPLVGGNGGAGGVGIWAAGGGGAGAYGVALDPSVAAFSNSSSITGGNGGVGGNAYAQSGGGGGGGSALFQAAGAVTNTGALQGGNGGNGGSAGIWDNGPSGGGGGGGGNGVVLTGGTLRNEAGGTITGGVGGNGGNAGPGGAGIVPAVAGVAGAAGGGGDGVRANVSGANLYNAGLIKGAAGGIGGTASAGPAGAVGAGGVGVRVTGDSNVLVNAGIIAGGLSGVGAQANAVTVTGNGNTVELRAGYGFTGNVVATGAGNVLALGGDATPATAFDVSAIGGPYQGFTGFAKTGLSTWTLSGTNSTFTGATTVTAGTLRAGAANAFMSASAHTVAAGATLDTAGFNQTVASLNNSGTVSLVSATPGSTLTVTGAYVGNGGVLKLGTFLGDSTSASDRLVLDGPGASASGNTNVQITNVGGLGALTTGNGINVITAQNGATTAANAFALNGGHVDAGAFEYRLYDGDAAGAGENWYLRSTTSVVPPVDPVTPPVTRPTYRAEVPLYSALPSILRQGDLAMLSTLHRRVGDEGGAGSTTPNATRAWGRLIGGNTTVTQNGTTAPESRTSIGGFQTGVDLFANDQWNAGLYVGHLRSDANVNGVYGLNLYSAYAGSLRADTTYLGGYATWANKNGLYVDTVLQYGIQDITGRSANALGTSADGKSLTASVEVGQRFQMGSNWALEPQAQLIYNRQNLGSTWIGGLTSVEQDTANAIIGRLGVRVTGDFGTSIGRLQPYARVNLWHGFKGTDSTSFLSPMAVTTFDNRIGYTSVEVAAGATLALTPTTSVYGELGSLFKAGGQTKVKSSVQGSVGVKLRF